MVRVYSWTSLPSSSDSHSGGDEGVSGGLLSHAPLLCPISGKNPRGGWLSKRFHRLRGQWSSGDLSGFESHAAMREPDLEGKLHAPPSDRHELRRRSWKRLALPRIEYANSIVG